MVRAGVKGRRSGRCGLHLLDSCVTHRYAPAPILPVKPTPESHRAMPVHAFIFPGQGSQAVGMGRDLAAAFAAAREVFEEVDDTLKQKLSKLMFEGPHEDLTLTENTQPALMAHSLAVLRVLEREGNTDLRRKALVVAGHSLGEYSALAASGAFSVPAAARLLKLRGQSMQQAVPAGIGAMAALLGAEMDQARRICEAAAPVPETTRSEIVQPANDNGGGQVVISGHRTAIERAIEIAKAEGIRRAMLLPVSAPFHCALMAPAAEAMAEAMETTAPAAPKVPLIANVSARRESDPGRIRDLLIQQVTATVRWRECVEAMTDMGVDSFMELGAGKVLTGLIKRIAPDAAAMAAGTPAEIEAMLKRL
jgi:[acyl-carrier-protein] S-malonyltransferase